MTATALDSIIFRDIFTTPEMRQRVLRRAPHRLLPGDRGGAGARAGPARHHPGGGGARDRRQVPGREHRLRQAQAARPSASAIRSSASCSRSWRSATRASANGATGAPPPRTSPTPPPSCRSAPRSTWSRPTWRGSPPRSPTSRAAIATRRWPAAATCSRRCRSPSASSAPCLLAAMQRHRARLRELRPRVLVGEFAGAVGTLASLGKDGLKVQEGLMEELKLGQPEIAWHTVRDRIGEVGCFLGLAHRHARQDLDGREAPDADRGGRGVRAVPRGPRLVSSTMPQKRNPIASLYIHATTALVRQNAAALLEAAVADHERSTGPWEIEWIALPEIFLLVVRRAAADPRHGRGPAGRRRAHARQSRPHRRRDRVRGGDDGARAASRPPARARPRLRHLPRGRDRPASRWSICWPQGRRDLPAREARRAGEDVRPGELSRPRRRDGRPCAGDRGEAGRRPFGRS